MSNIMFMNPKVQLDTIESGVAGIKTRGEFKYFRYDEAPGDTDFTEMINITGSGKLLIIVVQCITTAGTFQMTLDSEASPGVGMPADTEKFIELVTRSIGAEWDIAGSDTIAFLNLEFQSNLLVEVAQGTGTNVIKCCILYQED